MLCSALEPINRAPQDEDLLLELLLLHRDKLRRLMPIMKRHGGYRIWWRSGASW